MITLIDYGGSNIRSVQKAFEYVGATVRLAQTEDVVRQAEKLILPGVGAFGPAIRALKRLGLDRAISAQVKQGVPLLGICLGMQLLFDQSEEMGHYRGLGLIGGQVLRFPTNGPKVPHMGWNQISFNDGHPLLTGLKPGAYAYFVHSLYCEPADQKVTVSQTEYGRQFSAIVARENVFGIQFHPEKSQQVGLQVLSNFLQL